MKLWSAHEESLRAEARRVVDEALVHQSLAGSALDGSFRSLDEIVHDERAEVASQYQPHPQADERLLGGVWCRVFLPPGPVEAVYLHFHGGGMTVGAPEMDDAANHGLAVRFGLAIVSVDYRLAPEHAYPDASDDALAVARWLLDHAESELGSPRLIVGGEDVGAYLALMVVLGVRGIAGSTARILGANLVAGRFDWGGLPSQIGARADLGVDVLSPERLRRSADAYLPGRSDDERRRPEISPLYADLHDLCPALVAVGTRDHLLDDSLLLAARWAAAGNEVELVVLPELPHDLAAYECGLTASWRARTASWFAGLLAR